MSRFKKRLLIVAVLVLAASLLMSFHRKNEWANGILKPLSYPYDAVSKMFSSISGRIGDVMDSADENQRLKAQLRDSLVERQRYGEIINENKRLKELLGLKDQIQGHGIAAQVVARGFDKFINTLVIDKGTNDGIQKDMTAITARGLAGKVYATRGGFSDIMLLTDPNFSVAVRLQEGRHEGVLSGTGHWYCILKYIPTEETVKEGEIVVTSGLDGIFPQGLPVGRVTKVRTEGVEFFQYIEVVPFQSPAKIEEVMVIGRTAELKKPEPAPGQEAAAPPAAKEE